MLSFEFPEIHVTKATQPVDPFLDQLWDDYGDDLMQAILQAIAATTDAATIREVRDALANHDLMGALNALPWEQVGGKMLAQQVPTLIRGALEDSGNVAADALSIKLGMAGDVGLGFSITRDDVTSWVRSTSDNIIGYLSDAQADGIQRVIAEVMDQGLSVNRATSLLLDGDLVGLTPRDVNAVFNSLRRDQAAGVSLGEADQRAVEYTQRLLASRAQSIARTEMSRASTQGKLSMWRQAIQDGDMQFGAQKEWVAQEGCCDDCDDLDGEQVDVADTFSSGDDGPPLHPSCACSVDIVSPKAA
jgi:hypothetical protein